MDQIRCPSCDNFLVFDFKNSLTKCVNKSCKGLITEFGTITYEQEVNLHENEDQGQKQSRYGGYESRKEPLIHYLTQDMLPISTNTQERSILEIKMQKKFADKFDKGDDTIRKLAGQFQINDATTKQILSKYRELLITHKDKMVKKSFDVVAVIAFGLVVQEKKKKEWQFERKLSKLNQEIICQFANVDLERVSKLSKEMGLQHDKEYNKQQILEDLIKKAREFPFNEAELSAIRILYHNLLDSTLIRGEKQGTINSIIFICISQLSSNAYLATMQYEDFAKKNDVTKETVKKMWNGILDRLKQQESLIPQWEQKQPSSSLHVI